MIATQPTPSSTTASGLPTSGQTSGLSASGTSSGDAFSGASRGNAPPVGAVAAANANGATTVVATNGALVTVPAGTTQTVATNGAVVTTPGVFTTNGPIGIPIITDNGLATTTGVSINGERIVNPAIVSTELASTTSFAEPALPEVGVVTSAATDPAVRKELRKRQNLKRNGQLLYSIAPRTNVDRTWQTPDDGPTPALRTSP